MTQETVRALSDGELVLVITWAQGEQKVRAEQRKRETVAKIRELAQAAGVSINISGTRGRPMNKQPKAARRSGKATISKSSN